MISKVCCAPTVLSAHCSLGAGRPQHPRGTVRNTSYPHVVVLGIRSLPSRFARKEQEGRRKLDARTELGNLILINEHALRVS
jgi:hypothetical protein